MVLLRVNGEPVDPMLVEEAFARLKAQAEMLSQVSCCERDGEFRTQAEEEVIDGILLSQEAERRVPNPYPSEIREVFEKTLHEWREHGASWELLDSRTSEIHSEAVATLKMGRFTAGLWEALPPVAPEDLERWYQANLASFRSIPAARVVHLVRFPSPADPWEEYAAMLEWRRRMLAGEDFEELARAHTAKRSGSIELGWVEQERLLNPFEAMLFSLQENEISPVFLYEQALHLVKVVEMRPGAVRPLEEVKEIVEREVLAEQKRKVLGDLAKTLRESAVVEREMAEV